MADSLHPALLPAGLHDLLPPEAAHEAVVVEQLMAAFSAEGYQRVKPPLIEFEDSLLRGSGAALASETFRLMDPLSRRMLAVRADMTIQIARVAGFRLHQSARPLRLAYAGQVLRVNGSQLRPERQFGQVGVELIGSMRPEADAEVIVLAASALHAAGVARLSIDLCVPTLVPIVCRECGLPEAQAAAVRDALDRKDAAAVAAVGGPAGALLQRLMAACGPFAAAAAELDRIALPAAAEPERRRLIAVAGLVAARAPHLLLTLDAVERRGFEYQTGVSFTLFARAVRGELGRGGRYSAAFGGGAGEPAVGLSLYTDTLLRAVPRRADRPRVFLPHGSPPEAGNRLRAAGWITVAGLEPVADPVSEALRLRCDRVLVDPNAEPVDLNAPEQAKE